MRDLQAGDEEALESFLCRHPDSSMFLRGNLRLVGFAKPDVPYAGHYFAAFDDSGAIRAVIAHYWNGNVMVQADDAASLAAVIPRFVENTGLDLCGVVGNAVFAHQVIDALRLQTSAFAMSADDGLYSLDLAQLVPQTLERGEIVKAATLDPALLRRWIRAYDMEALSATDNAELDERVDFEVKEMIKSNGDRWALIVDGTPVCLLGFNARLPEIVQIGPVWTPPEHRNKGFARKLLSKTLEMAIAEGVTRALLFTDNPAGTKAYEAVGFQLTGAFHLGLLRQPIAAEDLRADFVQRS